MKSFSSYSLVTSCILLVSVVQIASPFSVGHSKFYQSSPQLSTCIRSTSTTNDANVQVDHDDLMYALGVNLARQLGDIRPLMENSAELTQVARGLLDTVIGKLSEEEQRALLKARGKEINDLITQRAYVYLYIYILIFTHIFYELIHDVTPFFIAYSEKLQQRAEAAGRSMLKTMSETEGVQVLSSGTCLHILEYGPDGPNSGLRPTAASTIKLHYHGTLADGTIFDSTLGMDPVSLPLGKIIPGWKEALLKMHEGETAMIGIPPEQGYGAQGSGDGRIPAGAALFFKVQLLEVLSAGVGGMNTLIGVDGKKLKKDSLDSSSLLGADGKPLFPKK